MRPTLGRDEQARALIAWQRLLHAAGYVGLHWPVAHGGRGATVMEQAIFYEEMARARAPELANAIGLDMAGPAIMVHGTEEQKRLHLPRILSAEHVFCQGFSEPNAGSDLAALETRAERRGRRLRHHGPQGVDVLRSLRELVHGPGPHRPGGPKAQGAHVLPRGHDEPGLRGAAAAPDER